MREHDTAETLGLIYNGPQRRYTGEIAAYLYTDTETGSTFGSPTRELPDVQRALANMRKTFAQVQRQYLKTL